MNLTDLVPRVGFTMFFDTRTFICSEHGDTGSIYGHCQDEHSIAPDYLQYCDQCPMRGRYVVNPDRTLYCPDHDR